MQGYLLRCPNEKTQIPDSRCISTQHACRSALQPSLRLSSLGTSLLAPQLVLCFIEL